MNDLQRKVLERLQIIRTHGPQWAMMVGILDTIIEKLQSIEKMEGPQGPPGIDGRTPVEGIDFIIPIPKDGRDGKDAEEQIYVSSTPPRNPKKGDLWSKI